MLNNRSTKLHERKSNQSSENYVPTTADLLYGRLSGSGSFCDERSMHSFSQTNSLAFEAPKKTVESDGFSASKQNTSLELLERSGKAKGNDLVSPALPKLPEILITPRMNKENKKSFGFVRSSDGSSTCLSFYKTANSTPINWPQSQYRPVSVFRVARRTISQSTMLYIPTQKGTTKDNKNNSYDVEHVFPPIFPKSKGIDGEVVSIYEDCVESLNNEPSSIQHTENYELKVDYQDKTPLTNVYEDDESSFYETIEYTETEDSNSTGRICSTAHTSPEQIRDSLIGEPLNSGPTDIYQNDDVETVKEKFRLLKNKYQQTKEDFNLLFDQYVRVLEMISHNEDINKTKFSISEVPKMTQLALISSPLITDQKQRYDQNLNLKSLPKKTITRPDTPDLTCPEAMITTVEGRSNIRIQPLPRGNNLKRREDMIYSIRERIDPSKRLLLSKSRAYHPWGFKPNQILTCSQKRGNHRIPTKDYVYPLESTSTETVAKRFKEERLRWKLRRQNSRASMYSFVDFPIVKSTSFTFALWRRVKRTAIRVLFPRSVSRKMF